MVDFLLAARAKMRMQRRLFFKALALGLSAPVAAKLIQSATAAPTGKPKRFMLYYVPHGVPPEHFNPVGEGTDFGLTESGVSILGPLEPYKAQMNVYEGFNYPSAGTHEAVMKFLSNAQVDNNDDISERTSIEHFIGNELNCPTLALGAVAQRPDSQDANAKLMWDGQAVVPQKSPLVAYDEVFSGLMPGAPPSSTTDELQASLLQLTEKDIASLQSEVASLSAEKSKLDVHLESIRAMSTTSGGGALSCTDAPMLEAVELLRASAAGQSDDWFLQEENFPQILAAQLEIAAAAMVCNARPITAVQPLYTTCDLDFGFMGASGSHHNGLSHTNPQISNGMPVMTAREPFAQAQRWFVEQLVSHVIEKLDVEDPADPGSTVLENTVILLCSEIGEGQWHTTYTREILTGAPPGIMSYMPIITLGGGGGALKTGQRINHFDASQPEGSGDRPASDVWLTLAQAMGVSVSEFGGSTGPVAEALA